MRFFRHDNHLLWFGVLAVVAVTIYLCMSYATTAKHEETSQLLQAHGRRVPEGVGTVDSETNDEDRADAGRPAFDTINRAHDSNESQRETSASHADPANKHVTFTDTTETVFSPTDPPSQLTSRTPPAYVFLDIAKQDFLKSPFVGRIVIQLFHEHAPRTTHNFAQLCADKKYVNIPFHRVVKDFMIQGGDIVNQDGTGTYSVYGGEGTTFADEPFALTHGEAGLLSMANSGPNTNGSQFFVLTQPAPHLDGKHVVFGKVVRGMEFVYDVEREVTDPNDRPVRKCYVLNCGVVTDETMGERTVNAQGAYDPEGPGANSYADAPLQVRAHLSMEPGGVGDASRAASAQLTENAMNSDIGRYAGGDAYGSLSHASVHSHAPMPFAL